VQSSKATLQPSRGSGSCRAPNESWRPSIVVLAFRPLTTSLFSLAIVLSVTALGRAQPVSAAVLTSRFIPVTPCRLLDTRERGAPVSVGTVDVIAAGRCGVPSQATAAVLTVTVVDAAAPGGFGTVWPAGRPIPTASNINFPAIVAVANSTVVALEGGRFSYFVSVPSHRIADVVGYFESATSSSYGRFVAVKPTRILDTRSDGGGPIPAGNTVRVDASAIIPAGGSPAVNIAFVDATSPGYVTAFSSGAVPLASTGNAAAAGDTRSLFTVVSTPDVRVFTSGGAHKIVDVVGYFTGPNSTIGSVGLFVPQSPVRAADTRSAPTISYVIRTPATVGSHAWVNVTSIFALSTGWAQATAGSTARQETSILNFGTLTDANSAIVAVSDAGSDFYTSTYTSLVIDTLGTFTGSHAPVDPAYAALPVPSASVLFISDSIGADARHEITTEFEARKSTVRYAAGIGANLCQFGDAIVAERSRKQVVVLQFSGNAEDICDYEAEIRRIAAAYALPDTQATLVIGLSPEQWRAIPMPGHVVGVNALYRSVAAEIGIRTIDLGSHLRDANGVFTESIGGEVVRRPDGVHLTHAGAIRMALSLIEGVERL
jgi:hypothetical protein